MRISTLLVVGSLSLALAGCTKAHRDRKAHRGRKGQQVRKANRVRKGRKVLKAPKEPPAHGEKRDPPGRKVR